MSSTHGFEYARRVRDLKPSLLREILKTTESPGMISFAGGLPAPELFPADRIAEICREILRDDPAGALQYGRTEGHPPLRQWVCDRLAEKALRCGPQDVLITTGSQQALDLIARVLIEPGDIVLVEDPSYLGALQAFGAYEADIVAVSSDAQGMSPEALRQRISNAARRPKFVYLVPNFHNPTGATIDLERRRALADVAERFGVPVLEDDPYGELRYDGAPLPSLASLLGTTRWIHLGTSSKVLAPGLRVGWLATPDQDLMKKLIAAKQSADLHTASLNQRIVWRFLSDVASLNDHLERLRRNYRERRDAMTAAIRTVFPEDCAFTVPDGGLFLWVRLPPRIDVMRTFNAALERQVAFVPGTAFSRCGRTGRAMRLNFSNANPSRIEEGVNRLGPLLQCSEWDRVVPEHG